MPPWANGKNGKEYRATMGRKPIVGIFSVGVEEPYRWKDSVQSERGDPPLGADGIANGLRPWFTKFAGALHDRRWLSVVEDLYRLARTATSATCATSARWRAWRSSTRSRPRRFIRRPRGRPRQVEITRWAGTRR